MSYWMSQKERLAVPVPGPFCKQLAGKTCQTKYGPHAPLYTKPHPARVRAAQEQARGSIR